MTKYRLNDTADPKASLDRFRKELKTEYFDILLLHCLRTATWTDDHKRLQDELSEAKAKKVILAHGASCHGLLPLRTLSANNWLDVALIRVNHNGTRMDTLSQRDTSELGDVKEVSGHARAIHAHGIGVLGMKLAGEGQFTAREDRQKALRFAMNLGAVDAVTIGYKSPAEVDEAIENLNLALA
jgi:predicted aldo/keto reductase-like oxidoreductase